MECRARICPFGRVSEPSSHQEPCCCSRTSNKPSGMLKPPVSLCDACLLARGRDALAGRKESDAAVLDAWRGEARRGIDEAADQLTAHSPSVRGVLGAALPPPSAAFDCSRSAATARSAAIGSSSCADSSPMMLAATPLATELAIDHALPQLRQTDADGE